MDFGFLTEEEMCDLMCGGPEDEPEEIECDLDGQDEIEVDLN